MPSKPPCESRVNRALSLRPNLSRRDVRALPSRRLYAGEIGEPRRQIEAPEPLPEYEPAPETAPEPVREPVPA